MTAYFIINGRKYARQIDIPQVGIGTGKEAVEAKEQALKQQLRDHNYGMRVRFGQPEQVYVIAQSKMNAAR